MKNVLIIYWPKKGNVENAANIIAGKQAIGNYKITPVTEVSLEDLNQYDNWIVGGSTVGSHIWEDADDSNRWFEFFKHLDSIDFSNKTVAFFGLGDQILYPHHFVDGLGVFQEEFKKRKVKIVGQWSTEGYNFFDSEGYKDKMFFGLALDEDNQEELTDGRIDKWLIKINKDFS